MVDNTTSSLAVGGDSLPMTDTGIGNDSVVGDGGCSRICPDFNITLGCHLICDDECYEACPRGRLMQFLVGYEGIPFAIGNCTSLLGLLATIVTYIVFRNLRTVPGKSILNLSLCLFLAKLAFQINPYLSHVFALCSVMAILQHYFCLSAFLWSSVIAVELYENVRKGPRPADGHDKSRILYTTYLIYAYGTPVSAVVACAVVEFIQTLEFHYGNKKQCGVLGDEALLYSLAIPLLVITMGNIIIYVLIICHPNMRGRGPAQESMEMRGTTRHEGSALENRVSRVYGAINDRVQKSWRAMTGRPKGVYRSGTQPGDEGETNTGAMSASTSFSSNNTGSDTTAPKGSRAERINNCAARYGVQPPRNVTTQTSDNSLSTKELDMPMQKQLRVYSKMSLLMATAWLAGFLAGSVNIYFLWLVFVLINALQGIFIFFSFVARKSVIALWKVRITHIKKRILNRGENYDRFADSSVQDGGTTNTSSIPPTGIVNEMYLNHQGVADSAAGVAEDEEVEIYTKPQGISTITDGNVMA